MLKSPELDSGGSFGRHNCDLGSRVSEDHIGYVKMGNKKKEIKLAVKLDISKQTLVAAISFKYFSGYLR